MAFKKSVKSVKPANSIEQNEDLHVNGSICILKNVEILFWAYSPVSSNPQYEPKYVVTIKLCGNHLEQMAAAKEAAVQYFIANKEPGLDPDKTDFADSIYQNKDNWDCYSFRSKDSYIPITEINGEPASDDVRIGKGSIANLAVRASVSKIFKSYNVSFYLNGVNITQLEEYKGKTLDLRAALR